MTKSIKIRPYRVFKKDGRHYVKINNKKVYIVANKRRSNKLVGGKQIVRVVVNNLMSWGLRRHGAQARRPQPPHSRRRLESLVLGP